MISALADVLASSDTYKGRQWKEQTGFTPLPYQENVFNAQVFSYDTMYMPHLYTVHGRSDTYSYFTRVIYFILV